MLVEFRVENFKNFREELFFKLDQIKNYEFNTEAIKDGIVRTALIYGETGSGKSNLGLGVFDIAINLTDREKVNDYSTKSFMNLSNKRNSKFYYKFKFKSLYLIYKYEKDIYQHIVKEELFINDERIIYYDHTKNIGEVKLKGAEALNTNLNKKNISFVKYIKRNTVLLDDEYNNVFEQFIEFVDNMLIYNSSKEIFCFDFIQEDDSISRKIIERGKLKEFELFLNRAGIECKLIEREIDGKRLILSDFDGVEVNFFNIASMGTRSLALFYYWLIDFEKISFVFIDEFDVFYNANLCRLVLEEVLKSNVQAIITAYNTSIIDNDFLRPDCYFNLVNGNIKSFANSTSKELRKAHNLEKMYRAGSFD